MFVSFWMMLFIQNETDDATSWLELRDTRLWIGLSQSEAAAVPLA